MPPISANVTNQQITASVGETKIDVSVSGGVGPTGPAGPAGTTDYTQLTNVPATFPPSAHGHTVAEVSGLQAALDGKQAAGSYATLVGGKVPESQLPPIVTTWDGLTGKPSTFPPSAHNHDDRYYTEAEVDTLLAGKQAAGSYAASVHAHTAAAITDFSSAALAAVTWGTLTGKPSTFAPSPHQHVAADISDFTSAVIAAAPPTTNASLLTSGTLPDARLSSNIARTSDVTAAVAAVVNAAPASLDTLQELAAALNNDASFATTVTNSLAGKAPINNPTFTGTVGGVTKSMVGLGNVPNVDATARANHTGTQAISTVSGLQAALDAKAPLADPSFTGTVDVNGNIEASIGYFSEVVVNGNHTITNATVNGATRLTVDGQVVVLGNDARLSDARTPTAHNQAWSTITSTPTTLAGYGITDAAALLHTHSASDIASGTLDASRLPIATANAIGAVRIGSGISIDGNGVISASAGDSVTIAASATDVLSVSSGTISADDPGADRLVFWDDSESKLTHLSLGTGLSISGTTLANDAPRTRTIIRFVPAENQPPATNFATLDTRNSFLVLEFDAATQESANFIGVIPEGATLTNGLTVRLWWMGDTATSGNVRWGVSFERVGTDNDADSFSSVTEATGAANGTSGIETVTSITATAIDSLAAGDRFRLRVARIAADATNDTMTGDAQLVAVEVQVA